jgi:LysM repeat protein
MALTTYRVVAGDTLFGIARKFNMTVDELKSVNRMTSNNLSVGQSLQVKSTSGGGTTSTGGGGITVIRPQQGTTTNTGSGNNGGGITVIRPQQGGGTSTPPPAPAAADYLAARREFTPEIVNEANRRRFLLRVRLLNGGTVLANMTDNVASQHTVFPNGILYPGQNKAELDMATIQSLGVSPQHAAALQYVSTHEGGFDAINSYDKAIFSYGFIQFAGGIAQGSSLSRLLAGMKANVPSLFNRIFQRVGIDVSGNIVSVRNEAGATLTGDAAFSYIQRTVPLYGAFIQAGFESQLMREQIRLANDMYVQPALNFKLDVTLGGLRITVPRLRDVLHSEGAITCVIALAINKGSGGMSRMVSQAMATVATQRGANSLAALQTLDERAIFQTLMTQQATDTRTVQRIQGVMNEGLSFA